VTSAGVVATVDVGYAADPAHAVVQQGMSFTVDRRDDAPFADQVGDLPPDASDAWWEYRRVSAERVSRGDAVPAHEEAVYASVLNAMWEAMTEVEQAAELRVLEAVVETHAAFDTSDAPDDEPGGIEIEVDDRDMS